MAPDVYADVDGLQDRLIDVLAASKRVRPRKPPAAARSGLTRCEGHDPPDCLRMQISLPLQSERANQVRNIITSNEQEDDTR